MKPELLVGILSLGGVTLGFCGTIVIETLRGRHERRREAADRRERFQVETLTQFQEVAKETYKAMLSAHWRLAVSVPPDGLSTKTHLNGQAADLLQMVGGVTEMLMLSSRLHNSQLGEYGRAFCGFVVDATNSDAQQDELKKGLWMAQQVYRRLQLLAGREVVAILDGRPSPPAEDVEEASTDVDAPEQEH